MSGSSRATWRSLLDYYPAWLEYRRWYLRIPGVQFALRCDGALELSDAVGVSNAETGERLTRDHLFRIASHSKTVAAVLILQLLEEGTLRLDDTLAGHLPELSGSPVADRTIRELLTHSGGVIRDSTDGDFWQAFRPFPDREELLAIARDPTAAVLPRNDHYKYSNIAYGLLGMVIEAVTGESFPQRVAKCVAEPLGLRNFGGEIDSTRAEEYAAGHGGLATARERGVIPHVDTRALAAATGCYATAEDLTAFFSALLPGRDVLLGADAQRIQRHWQWEVKKGEQRYGVGVILDRIAETELFGHTGGYPGHVTCTFADPATGRVISVLTNAVDGAATELASGLFHLLNLSRTADHSPAADDAVRFTGRFRSMWGVLDVVRLDGRLFALNPTDQNPADAAAPLTVVDDETLRIVGGRGGNSYGETMRYTFDGDGEVVSLRGDSGMSMTPFLGPDEP
jgi:CubicO group peptidase (beta-lactamase class C family)